MNAARSLAPLALLAALLVAQLAEAGPRHRRQLADDNSLQPLDDASADEQAREKRKLEGATQAKFGIKNAILGFVFGSGATSHRQERAVRSSRTRTNLQDTASTGSSQGRRTSVNRPTPTNSLSQLRSPDTQAIQDTSDRFSRSNSQATKNTLTPVGPNPSNTRVPRQTSPRPTDDIPVFDRNKVSLNIPGSLFGPSVSLLIRTTKIVGDVIQNSAVRYQTFLRLFRPLFRGPFEIKGLDPPTTTPRTTTRPTTTTARPPTEDNEIRRKRHL